MRERRVLVSGALAEKPSRLVARSEPVVVTEPRRYVSRGGDKLKAALDEFSIDVAGRYCLDAGASTGGFTDCLLEYGARRVWAVDVGHGQLAPQIRADPRVSVFERCNIRNATLEALAAPPFELVVADLSHISLRTVAPKLVAELAAPTADLVVLVKPQFEAGRVEVAKNKGVIRDPSVWRETVESVASALMSLGSAIMGLMTSPVRGAAGNVEFLVHARTACTSDPGSFAGMLDRTIAGVEPGAG